MSDIESIPINDENKPNFNQIIFPNICIIDIIRRNSYLYIGLGVKARVYLKNIEHKTPIMRIEFGCTEIIKYKDNGAKYCGFNICLELEKNYSEFLTELKTDIINYCGVHSSYLECPHNKRILDNLYKSQVYKRDTYPSLLNASFGNGIDIDIYSTSYINKNGLKKFTEPIQVKASDINYNNLKKVLKRGTIVQLVIDIPYFDIYDTQIRPCIKVKKIIIYI